MSSRYLNAWHGKNFQTGEICWQGRWSTKLGAVSRAGSCVYAVKTVGVVAGTLITKNTEQEEEDELRWGQGGGAHHLSHPSPRTYPAWPGPHAIVQIAMSVGKL